MEKIAKSKNASLKKMQKGGYLFAIVPNSILAAGKDERRWRNLALENHTLKASIKLPDDLFYPIGVVSSVIILEAHKPHNKTSEVFFGAIDDGFVKKKGVMKKRNDGNIEKIKAEVKSFIYANLQRDVAGECITSPLDFDKLDEWCSEAYLTDKYLNKDDILSEMKVVFYRLVSFEIVNSK